MFVTFIEHLRPSVTVTTLSTTPSSRPGVTTTSGNYLIEVGRGSRNIDVFLLKNYNVHTLAQAHAHTHAHSHMQTYMYIHIHTLMRTHAHSAQTHLNKHLCALIFIHSQTIFFSCTYRVVSAYVLVYCNVTKCIY